VNVSKEVRGGEMRGVPAGGPTGGEGKGTLWTHLPRGTW